MNLWAWVAIDKDLDCHPITVGYKGIGWSTLVSADPERALKMEVPARLHGERHGVPVCLVCFQAQAVIRHHPPVREPALADA